MKKILLLFAFIVSSSLWSLAQVGIGTENPHPTAALEIESNDKGLLISRMTSEQKNAIQNPAKALLIYQMDGIAGFYFFEGSNWVLLNPVDQKNPDWNAVSGVAQILNKPELSKAALTGNFSDLNDIPAVVYASDTSKMLLPFLTLVKIQPFLDSKVDLTAFEAEIQSAKAAVQANTVNIVQNAGDINRLNTAVSQNTSDILANTFGISTNASAIIGLQEEQNLQNTAIAINTAKEGITTGQSDAIIANTAKVGYTDVLVSSNADVAANTLKGGITPQQTSDITANNAKAGITTDQSEAIIANTAKVGYTDALVSANADVLANKGSIAILSEYVDLVSKLPAGNVFIGNAVGETVIVPFIGGDVSMGMAGVVITDNAITSSKILDGTIVNADISANAAIGQSKIADLTDDLAAKASLDSSPTFTGTITAVAFEGDGSALTNLPSSAGLVSVTENNNTGYRRADANPNNYGDIGSKAVDLSSQDLSSTSSGASGNNSVAMGNNTVASGIFSTAMGFRSTANANFSTSMGHSTTARGVASTAMGRNTTASDYASLVIGQFNNAGNSETGATLFSATAPAFVIGNGINPNSKGDAFVVDFSGNVTASKFIGDGSALTNLPLSTGLASVTENNKTGYRRADANPNNHGDIGNGAVDISFQNQPSTSNGASGDNSVAMGYTTVASGDKSTAMGSFNRAEGNYSTAMGLGTTASGYSSLAMGDETTAKGSYSTAMGKTTTASDYASLVIGQFNNRGNSETGATEFSATTPAFVIGNGADAEHKGDAFVVDFSGNVVTGGTIKAGTITYPNTDGTEGQLLATNGGGVVSWITPSAAGSSSFVDLTSDQTISGLKTFGKDLVVNGAIIGRGSGNKSSNNVFGTNTLAFNTSGVYNIAYGNDALRFNTTGSDNVAIGSTALMVNGTGSLNTAIGNNSGVSSGDLRNTTAIGYYARVAASNTIQLGNADITDVRTSGKITSGAITLPNTAGANGQVLTTDGIGNATWETPASGGVNDIGTSELDGSTVSGLKVIFLRGSNVLNELRGGTKGQILHLVFAPDQTPKVNDKYFNSKINLEIMPFGLNSSGNMAISDTITYSSDYTGGVDLIFDGEYWRVLSPRPMPQP